MISFAAYSEIWALGGRMTKKELLKKIDEFRITMMDVLESVDRIKRDLKDMSTELDYFPETESEIENDEKVEYEG